MLSIAECSRVVFHQWTQASVANSTFLDGVPRAAVEDELALVETDDRLGQGVVVAIAAGADRGHRTLGGQALGVDDREILLGLKESSQRRAAEEAPA